MKFLTAFLLSAIAGLAAVGAGNAPVVWLETERFADYGGWVNDAQFIDQMGSPYLLANGMGEPVKDALTRVALPSPGKWRVWARTKDWSPEHHPGKFQIALNDKVLDRDFGASGKAGWHWEDGGTRELSGNVEVRLHDLTGYYGRCDAIVFSTDPTWTPPDDLKSIAALREQFGGVSREVQNAGEYDVVVAGGGLAGSMAAVSAARLGARTALIQDRPVLGGNGSTELLVPPVGVRGGFDPRDPRETGLIEEVRTEGRQRTPETRYYSSRLKRLVEGEPNLKLYLNTHVTGTELQPGSTNTIAAVLAVATGTGQRLRFGGREFIDCTGDGTVGFSAGAVYRVGREPRSMYNESLAPEKGDPTTMGNSIKYASLPTGKAQPFASPPWAIQFPTCDSFPEGRHPPHLTLEIEWQWKLELGGIQDTIRDKEEIRDDLFKLAFGIWDHVKNKCGTLKAQAAEHKLAWIPYVMGVRESRRLIGDYVFIENDVANQTLFPDRVAYGAWGLDDHYSEGFWHVGAASHHPYGGVVHSIPYRSLYSTNINNLLMAGRDISASHIGMGTTRVQLTCAVAGMAAGTAAAMCIEKNTTPRGILQSYLEPLQQQLLKDGAYLVDLPNRDPHDLARQAQITASSEGISTTGERMRATNIVNGIARAVAGRGNAWQADPDEGAPHWIELAWPQPQTFNVVHVTFFKKELAPPKFTVEAWADGRWQTLMTIDKQLHRHTLAVSRTTAGKLRVVLPEAAGICEVRVYDEAPVAYAAAKRSWEIQGLPDGPDARLPWETNGIIPFGDVKPTLVTGLSVDDAMKKFGGIIVDDLQAKATGEWLNSTWSQVYVGAGCLHDNNQGKGAKSLTFELKAPAAGRYEVRFAYAATKNRASNVPVTIRTPRETKTVTVNEQLTHGPKPYFHPLAQFDLAAGDAVMVIVSTQGTDNIVSADAVQLVRP